MKKSKLIAARKQRDLSQEQLAELLAIDTSSYNRREKGKTKITENEWQKIAGILDMPLEEIYEPEEGFIIIKGDNAVGVNNGTNNIYTIPQSLWETQQKYIQKLEEEIAVLKKQ